MGEAQLIFEGYSYNFAALVISFYDILLTFSREVECIWQRKFSVGTVLFFVTRYCNLARALLELVVTIYVPKSIISCKIMIPIKFTLEVLCPLSVAIFSSLRIWAICGRKWLPFSVVLVFSLFAPAAYLYNATLPRKDVLIPGSSADGGGCQPIPLIGKSPPSRLPVIKLAIAIAADALILAITWWKTADIWRATNQSRGNFRLVNLLLRDGTVYFCLLLILNIVTLILDAPHGQTQFTYLNATIPNVLVARFILDLRGVYYSDSSSDNSNVMSCIKFAGNLGAPLDDFTWTTGAGDDPPAIYIRPGEESTNPMADGLLVHETTNSTAVGNEEPHVQRVVEDTPEGT